MLLHCLAFGGFESNMMLSFAVQGNAIGMDTEERQIESYKEISIFDLRGYEQLEGVESADLWAAPAVHVSGLFSALPFEWGLA